MKTLFGFYVVCQLVAGLALVPMQAAEPPGFLKGEFIYETAPFPSCHASTIVETKSGLVAAWFGGTRERDPDVCIYVSYDETPDWFHDHIGVKCSVLLDSGTSN